MDVIGLAAAQVHIYAAAEALRPRPAVYLPFLVIGGLLRQQRGLRKQRQQILVAERDVTELRVRPAIRIGRREHVVASLAAHAQNDERRVHERLKAEIAVHVLGERSVVRDISRLRLKAHGGVEPGTTLTSQPVVERGQKGLAWSRHSKPLV